MPNKIKKINCVSYEYQSLIFVTCGTFFLLQVVGANIALIGRSMLPLKMVPRYFDPSEIKVLQTLESENMESLISEAGVDENAPTKQSSVVLVELVLNLRFPVKRKVIFRTMEKFLDRVSSALSSLFTFLSDVDADADVMGGIFGYMIHNLFS